MQKLNVSLGWALCLTTGIQHSGSDARIAPQTPLRMDGLWDAGCGVRSILGLSWELVDRTLFGSLVVAIFDAIAATADLPPFCSTLYPLPI
ncbi:hypothetical protein [Chamaesiphon sp.]|uniref:hypothetical protein n=1 Tax=Chamaesiphon sp. TaxID=2814140 RepID=UPI003593D747